MNMKIKTMMTFVALVLLAQMACAQSKETVKGEYRMMVPEYMNREEARLTAIEQAKIEALRDKFGTIVSQTNLLIMEEANNRSNNSFYSLGQCDVKGVWLKDLEEPTITEAIVDGQHWMTAKVKGIARELIFAKTNIETHLLKNGKSIENESDDYRDGDRFYISFRSPAKGYLAIYLLDAERNAFPIIPNLEEDFFPVKRGERYVFIDDDKKHLILTTDVPQELNQVYIIFSPNKFYSENMTAKNDDSDLERYRTEEFNNIFRLPYVPYKKFQKWISNLRMMDTEMQVVTKIITIKGKE